MARPTGSSAWRSTPAYRCCTACSRCTTPSRPRRAAAAHTGTPARRRRSPRSRWPGSTPPRVARHEPGPTQEGLLMSPATGARRRAREVAFRVAYQADVAGDAYPVAWGLRREQEDKLTADQLELIEDLVAALEQRTSEVDGELQSALE